MSPTIYNFQNRDYEIAYAPHTPRGNLKPRHNPKLFKKNIVQQEWNTQFYAIRHAVSYGIWSSNLKNVST